MTACQTTSMALEGERAAVLSVSRRFRLSHCPMTWLTLATSLHVIFAFAGCRQSTEDEAVVEHIHARPLRLTDENFQELVTDSHRPILVDMWAPWCEPCIEMKPIIRQLTGELHGQVNVGELNVAENAFIAEKYKVDRYPMLLLFIEGEEVERLVGPQSMESLSASLRKHISLGEVR